MLSFVYYSTGDFLLDKLIVITILVAAQSHQQKQNINYVPHHGTHIQCADGTWLNSRHEVRNVCARNGGIYRKIVD